MSNENHEPTTNVTAALAKETPAEARVRDPALQEATDFLEAYSRLPEDFRLGKRKLLIHRATELGVHLKSDQSYVLVGGIALALIVRDGLFYDVKDPRNPDYRGDQKQFIAEFLEHFQIGDSPGRVSYLLSSGTLWSFLAKAGEPPPPNLSRLEPLVSLEPEDALKIYRGLVAKAGGEAPSYTAILEAARRFKGREVTRPAGNATVARIHGIAAAIIEVLNGAAPDLAAIRSQVEEVLKLTAPKPKAQPKVKAVVSRIPDDQLPFALNRSPGRVVVVLKSHPGFVAHVLNHATKLRLQDEDGTLVRILRGGRSQQNATVAELKEKLTRMAELFLAAPAPKA